VQEFVGVDCSPNHFSIVSTDREGHVLEGFLLGAEPNVLPAVKDVPLGFVVACLPEWYPQVRKQVSDDAASAARMDLVVCAIAYSMQQMKCFSAPRGPVCAAMEDFAYAVHTGAYDIGGIAYLMRYWLLARSGLHLRLHDPGSLKLLVGSGREGSKIKIAESVAQQWPNADWRHLVQREDAAWSDVVDAYLAAQAVRLEWRVRQGLSIVADLRPNERRLINRVTKSRSVNLVDRPWVLRLPNDGPLAPCNALTVLRTGGEV